MQLPVNITYRGLKKSLGIEQMVLEKATRLDKFCDHISRCDVAIEQPNHTHKKGNQFRVRMMLPSRPVTSWSPKKNRSITARTIRWQKWCTTRSRQWNAN